MLRYFKLYRKHIIYALIIIALVIISSVTKGNTAKITAVAAGIVMIYAGFSFVLWIIRTPVKKDNDQMT